MAYQAGPLRLKGKLGDLSFYFNRDCGYLIRQKGGPQRDQVLKSPTFARTRENASEFALAVRAGKLIRLAIKASLGLTGDSKVSQRLAGLLVKIGKTDLSLRGNRNPAAVFNEAGSRELLKSFAFYERRPLRGVYNGKIDCDLFTGSIVLIHDTIDTEMPGQAPAPPFRAPKGATHVQIKAVIIDFDFEQNSYTSFQAPVYNARLESEMPQATISCNLTTAGTGNRIGIVAITFLQEQHGTFYSLTDGMSLGVIG